MSLINLASKTNNDIIDQQPFNFKNHFPQPLIIKANSQVCLTHFYHSVMMDIIGLHHKIMLLLI